MDKTEAKGQDAQSDTSSVITMKEYASSEYPSSEPPPAYIKPRSNALRIARLAAFTVIVSSVILGGFILAASWIQANTARNLDLTLNQELLDDMHPSYEHLIANEGLNEEQDNALGQGKPDAEDKVPKTAAEKGEKNDEGLVPPPPPQEEKQALDLDEIAAMLMQKNIRGNVNCIVEKKRNEELVDHAPRNLNLPFGLNITTPPRLQHLTGEQMVVICKGDEEEEKDESKEDKEEQVQQMIFPLPAHLINQIQQVPQVIPIQQLLQQTQPQQQILYHQPPQQQVIYQQPPQQQVLYQQPPQQQVLYQQPPQQQVFYHQQPQQQLYPQQQVYYQQPQVQQQNQVPYMEMPQRRPEMRYPAQEMVPLKEMRLNQEGIPMNHVLHHRVPVNPMAVQDVPLSQMSLTHMPMRAEPQQQEQQEGPVPVHHLVPPQPQEVQVENFSQEEPRFNRPLFRERLPNRFNMGYQPLPSPASRRPFPPVDVREPRLIRLQRPQEARERVPIFPFPIAEFNDNKASENREEMDTPTPVEGRLLPFPNSEMRPPFPNRDERPDHSMPPFLKEQEPKIIRMIPLSLERRPMPISSRIRFPDMPEIEEPRDRRLPIITEITKIIPIRIEKEQPRDKIQVIPLTRMQQENPMQEIKNIEDIDNKLEKGEERPFPIPINAILDMIFRGIRPLVNGRANSMPIPIDIKIERIENKPIEGINNRPMIEKFEFFDDGQNSSEEEDEEENSEESTETMTTDMPRAHSRPLQPSTLMLDDIKVEKAPESKEEAQPIAAKVEQVEIVEKEAPNTQAIAIPADIQDPEIFKLEEAATEADKPEEVWEPRAFLPNGQGRGARVFPIPQEVREAEIFSVSDARASKSMQIQMGTTMNVEEKPKEEPTERQSRVLNLEQLGQPEGEVSMYPLSEGRAMKPLPNPQVQLQGFSVHEGRSQQLFPVQDGDNKPAEEDRPHLVQPRSV